MATPGDREVVAISGLDVVPFAHPQGCRGYLLADTASKEALALDVHLDSVHDTAERIKAEGWTLRTVVDTHTHADHPSGAGELAALFDATRVAHEKANHAGVTLNPKDGEEIKLGETVVTVRHAPGHTPDHMALVADGALFSGDSLFIGGVARTDFLGGDAGLLFDSVHKLLADLPETAVLFPGHDYEGRIQSTLADENAGNPWLQISDRAAFVQNLTANPPPRPANMDDLLRLNREGVDIPASIAAAEAIQQVSAGGAVSVIDVRTGAEYDGEHIPGVRLIPLDQIQARIDEVRAVAAPRLMMCRTGSRAAAARDALLKHHLSGMTVVDGGMVAYIEAGGDTVKGKGVISLERQVRIAAGSLVVLGVLLGAFVHPAFLILSGFVGCGLVFAGVTDTCGMGMMLSKMPWNQSKSSDGASSAGGTCAASLPGACAAAAPGQAETTPPAGTCAAAPPGQGGDDNADRTE
jgi:glyoxylase-like metal-dependent hydrolase (beta-lactamase superfamily II)/rhodanese-related sulfurtransferase